MLANNFSTSKCFAIFERIMFMCFVIFELIIFWIEDSLTHTKNFLSRTNTRYSLLLPRSKFNLWSPRTHNSTGSRTCPAIADIRNMHRLTRPMHNSTGSRTCPANADIRNLHRLTRPMQESNSYTLWRGVVTAHTIVKVQHLGWAIVI